MAQGHMIPMMDIAKTFATRGAKVTIIATPPYATLFSKRIERIHQLGLEFNIETVKFPSSEVGLPEGWENPDAITRSQNQVELLDKFRKTLSLLREPILHILEDHRPDCLVADLFFPWATDVAAQLKIPRSVSGRKAWQIGPVSLCNRDTVDKAMRAREASISSHECLRWLDSKRPNSVVYVCFGSVTKISSQQLVEIAKGLEASQQDFIWIVRKDEDEEKDWLPEEFEERMGGKGLVISGWAPQLLILDHEAVGGFVTHCGWNSILEGVCASVPMVTWPMFAEQFYNEKLVTQVLGIGIGVGSKQYAEFGIGADVVGGDDIEKAVRRVMAGEEAEEMRRTAKVLGEMARKSVGEGRHCVQAIHGSHHDAGPTAHDLSAEDWVDIGVKQWVRLFGDIVKSEKVEEAVKRVLVGKEAEEMRRAKALAEMARGLWKKVGLHGLIWMLCFKSSHCRAEQFYNEKLMTQVLKIGVNIRVKWWVGLFGDSAKSNRVEEAVKRVRVGEEAEEMRRRAKALAEMARGAVEEGGSSWSDLGAVLQELILQRLARNKKI
ncbi:hypothetical protein NL676_015684 [Syzygium grande]|nr:hypothetical protein NL676_015684 [Syzygium grande]